MIEYTTGNILEAQTEAIVNTVNTVGVMGKGIALMFKNAYPANYEQYLAAVRKGTIDIGTNLVVDNCEFFGPRWIINFPTKRHWRNPSKLEWVYAGLQDLTRTVSALDIQSIAIPPLGCGAGKLSWVEVRPLIEEAFAGFPHVRVVVYEPTEAYQNRPKEIHDVKLTPARAAVIELIRQYEKLGYECTILEVQKLGWLLEQTLRFNGVPGFEFDFKPQRYGPYSDKLRHLLDTIDGAFIRSDKRIADTSPYDEIRTIPERGRVVDEYLAGSEMASYRESLDRTVETFDGFQSPLGMELLTTVHWVMINRKQLPDASAVRRELRCWPGNSSIGERKYRLMTEQLITAALDRLRALNLIANAA